MTMDFRKTFFLILFFMSGFCNLTYEIVWVRMLNLVFGVTVFAVSAVVASFMLGMALGAIGFGGRPHLAGRPIGRQSASGAGNGSEGGWVGARRRGTPLLLLQFAR